MKPLGKRVLIAEVQKERKSTGGIILSSDASLRETKFAKILEVGEEVTKVKIDDTIVLDWSKCYPVKVDGIERAIVDEDHILAIS